MNKWKLIEPDEPPFGNSDLIKIIENGESYAIDSLPGLNCSKCTSWGYSCLSSHEISKQIVKDLNLKEVLSLKVSDFNKLQANLIKSFLTEGLSIKQKDLPPGLSFPPLLLDIPEPPRFDVLWRGEFLLISQKARSVIAQFNDGSSSFCRAKYGRVGKWFPKEISEWDAEGIIDVEDALEYVTEFYPSDTPLNYYGLVITARSYPTDFIPNEVCEECGRFAWQREPQIQNPHIFYIGDTLWIGVSNQLKEALEDEGITNLSFSAIVD